MKLTKEQILHIEYYLESKKLYQIDLKLEVLDHMISGVESRMQNKKISFEDAFEKEREFWKNDLRTYAHYVLGFSNKGPKIMMKKCLRLVKKIYFKTLLYTTFITALVYFLVNYINFSLKKEVIHTSIGTLFFVLFVVVLILKFKISSTKLSTTYRYLYKIHVFGISFAYIYLNPLLHFNGLIKDGRIHLLNLFVFVFVAVHFFSVVDLFRKHSKLAKQQIA